MPPLTPHWAQPSHPEVLTVVRGLNGGYTSKAISNVDLPAGALFAKLTIPPMTLQAGATYATVQLSATQHYHLNSDLVYINHGCDPNLIFDFTKMKVIVGPKSIKVGDQLRWFYPSSEWEMAQGFTCTCGGESCKDQIDGAKNMSKRGALDGYFLNEHIKELLFAENFEAISSASSVESVCGSSCEDSEDGGLEIASRYGDEALIIAVEHLKITGGDDTLAVAVQNHEIHDDVSSGIGSNPDTVEYDDDEYHGGARVEKDRDSDDEEMETIDLE